MQGLCAVNGFDITFFLQPIPGMPILATFCLSKRRPLFQGLLPLRDFLELLKTKPQELQRQVNIGQPTYYARVKEAAV